jgi:hypothetical protein
MEHVKVAARKAATTGKPGPEMFTVLRELIQMPIPVFPTEETDVMATAVPL